HLSSPAPERLRTWRLCFESVLALADVLDRELERDAGIPLRWYDALIHLEDAPDGLRMNELAERILYSKSGFTRVVDRMEDADLVRRVRHENDRRSVRAVLAALSLALLASAAAQGGGVRAHYIFRGHLLATPPANATSISLTVEGGNRIALKAMLGASVDQNFAVGTGTEFLRWSHGVPTVVHANDLRAGDWAVVNVRAPYGSSLAQVESRPAGIVADRGAKPNPPTYPLFLFRGRVAAPAGTSTLSVDVRGGNRRGLRLLLGNTRQQSFTFGPETIFLRWQGKV